ncbi:hypothetical protein D3C80_1513630 [compost metagenome]
MPRKFINTKTIIARPAVMLISAVGDLYHSSSPCSPCARFLVASITCPKIYTGSWALVMKEKGRPRRLETKINSISVNPRDM